MIDKNPDKPRILIVSPLVTYLPDGMGNLTNYLVGKGASLADISSDLMIALFNLGLDVHIFFPDFSEIYAHSELPIKVPINREIQKLRDAIPQDRIHIFRDRRLYYLNRVYSNPGEEHMKISLSFQKNVLEDILWKVKPEIIHCNDWMTGLVPAMARTHGIRSLFTLHNLHTEFRFLHQLEDVGIKTLPFWNYLFFEKMTTSYRSAMDSNRADLLTSGIFAAHYVNTVSETFLGEIVNGNHEFVGDVIRQEIIHKFYANCIAAIPNEPEQSYNPANDGDLPYSYDANNHADGKRKNKAEIQNHYGLLKDESAPLFFWPSPLDDQQKGCQLMLAILQNIMRRFTDQHLQIIFVASGAFKTELREMVFKWQLDERVAVCDFDEKLARLAYAASDFVLMPSKFETGGLPHKIGMIYGSLPIAHDTGGIHDAVTHLDLNRNLGNGFLFRHFDEDGFNWAIGEAMKFYSLPTPQKKPHIQRIMEQSVAEFSPSESARAYSDLYAEMMKRPLVR